MLNDEMLEDLLNFAKNTLIDAIFKIPSRPKMELKIIKVKVYYHALIMKQL